jgi:uridylate kinase
MNQCIYKYNQTKKDMKKRLIIISLGGSLIIPNRINLKFLNKFKKIILENLKNYKFIIICGGGNLAREYISALKKINLNKEIQSLAGISATRANARFMSYFFNINPKKGIPHKIKNIEKNLKKRKIIFCGALKYKPKQTSDSTSAEVAKYFKTNFINLTNVDGLYDKDPSQFKNAKLISKISWENFNQIVQKIKFKPGQHFVLDQSASKIILKNKIKTYIIGENLNNLNNLLKDKKFKGTIISNK